MNLKLATFGLTAMALVTACSNDEIEKINLGNEITFNTSVSTRAAEMTTDKLSEFNIWADAEGYKQLFISGEKATKPANANYFSLGHAIFWPSEVASIHFWAVSPTDVTVTTSDLKPQILGFTPAAEAENQVDLITAYTKAMRGDGTNVNINFHHALSQIVVRAKAGVDGDETKSVMIKGAWIVNVKPSGNLSFVPEGPMTDVTDDASTDPSDVFIPEKHMLWHATDNKTIYGREFTGTEPMKLSHTLQDLLSFGKNSSNLMLVPQQLDTWNLNDNDDKSTNAAGGAYILLLCRVEAVHNGEEHPGGADAIHAEDGKHYHQLFPYTTKFDRDEYGYTCVPINDKWEPGKKYVYNLQFCGATSGAGVYPPKGDLTTFNLPDGSGKYIKTIPTVSPAKGPGDPVLDNPINFTVKVEEWTEEWKNGTMK